MVEHLNTERESNDAGIRDSLFVPVLALFEM